MAKSKYAPALFEVIQNRSASKSSGLPVPKWWKSGTAAQEDQSPAQEQPEEAPAPPEPAVQREPQVVRPEPAPVRVAVPPRIVPASPPEAPDGVPERAPFFRLNSGRVELSMTPTNAAVIIGTTLLLVIGFYYVGQNRGRAALAAADLAAKKADPLAEALNKPANPAALKVAAPAPRTSTPPRPAVNPPAPRQASTPQTRVPPALPTPPTETATPRGASDTYIVLETFGADDGPSAEFAQKWLAARQLGTVLEKKGSRWRLVSTVGFAPGEEQKLQQYIETVKTVGRECARDMGRAKLQVYLFTSPGKISGRELEKNAAGN